MKTSDFYYDLPQELIAQTPLEPRDSSRLMNIDRSSGTIDHRYFYELADLLQPGDLLVVNDSRVIPARLYGRKEDTSANIEFLLLLSLIHILKGYRPPERQYFRHFRRHHHRDRLH